MDAVAAGRLLLAWAALSAIPGSATATGTLNPALSDAARARTDDGGAPRTAYMPEPVLKAWLVRFGSAIVSEVPTSESVSKETDRNRDSGALVVWGRSRFSRLAGSEDDLKLDGAVSTGILGADWSDGRWLAGLALSLSIGEGAWTRGSTAGQIESSATGLYPYTGYEITDRIVVWGTAGYGIGALTLIARPGERLGTDVALLMAAAGARGDLVDRAGASGPALSIAAGGLYASTTSQATSEMAAAEAAASRMRLALEGSWGIVLPGGALLTPTVEIGAGHDGGDADTGFGAGVGGGIALADASGTLAVAVSGRMLLWHEAGDVRGWSVSASVRYTTNW